MNFIEIAIKPDSSFSTPLKGDTVFGQFCSFLSYADFFGSERLSDALKNYDKEPFLVCSSGILKCSQSYYLPSAKVPGKRLFSESELEEKKHKGIYYHQLSSLSEPLDIKKLISAKDLEEKKIGWKTQTQIHVSINRLYNTATGSGFDPYPENSEWCYPATQISFLIGFNETFITKEEIQKTFEQIGRFGFGKDASTGKGRFTLTACNQVNYFTNMPRSSISHYKYFYGLSPFIPSERDSHKSISYRPFTRFGKHGAPLSTQGKVFKKPVLMAEEGFLIEYGDTASINLIAGTGLKNVSRFTPDAVHQAYSILLPVINYY